MSAAGRGGRSATTTCMLTAMDEPLGAAVGNALEVGRGGGHAVGGSGPADLVELCITATGC